MINAGKMSLCMIVKNEEKRIARCLESVKNVVDEMIIVDTGSTDGTKEICRSFGASVYTYEWKDHFGEARNFGIDKASGEWILWLDADEEVETADAHHLRDVFNTEECYLGLVRVINYYGKAPHDSNRSHVLEQSRLFRNEPRFRFNNAIHEQLSIETLDSEGYGGTRLPVTVHHYGYMDETVTEKKKGERNLRLLEKEKDAEGYSPWVDYHIGSELYRAGEFVRAFDQVNVAIRRFLASGKKPPSLLYKLKYTILINVGSFEGARTGIELAIQMYPDYVDLYFCKGVILFELQQFEEAIEVFKQCLEIKEEANGHLTLVGSGSFHAWFYLGSCYQKLGHIQQAELAYIEALTLYPSHEEAQEALYKLGQSRGEEISVEGEEAE
ncbi:glycosyltransferase [Paenibacillaceae bacterium]|nr:glycosyltransferase [Paenibacillaceae bacterium]